ncbi:MAG: response regulator transcription factor [Burkholderiaceae bacterium]
MNRTVLLVDDHAAFRESTAWLLDPLGYEVRAFDSAAALLDALAEPARLPACACVLLDVRMPGIDGLQLHDALLARGIGWPVVYMTGHGDVPLAVAAMRKGAYSFLEKPFRESALEETLSQAFAHAEARRRESAAAMPSTAPGAPATDAAIPPLPPGAARLTGRERQVLELVVQGKLNKTIADILGISIKTVELHRANMMQKMGVRSITELMRCVLTGVESGA